MSPEKQQKAIALACGWREAFPPNEPPHPATRKGGILLPYYVVHETTGERRMHYPDYRHDLNEMHEAEKVLFRDEVKWATYRAHLARFHYINDTFSPSAAQRAEAFLRTLGLWEAQPTSDSAYDKAPRA